MKIALDYDGTYTLDPEFWNRFIDQAIDTGHQITCVTMRFDDEVERIVMPIPIVYTGRKAKRDYCLAHYLNFDVWIDDKPHYVYQDAAG